MYVVLNIIKVKQEFLEDFVTGVRDHASNSLTEPGCVRYEVLQDLDDPQTICLYEVFKDEAAFKEHLTHGYYNEWITSSKDWRHGENRIRHVLDYIK